MTAGRPLTTIAPGTGVIIVLRGRATDRSNAAVGGEVVAADAIAVRLRAAWSRTGMGSAPTPVAEEIVLPWAVIERVRIEAAS